MCFAPLKCLKGIVFLGAICSIVISIALLAMTIYVQVEKSEIISSAHKGAITGALVALYITSIVFLILGICGLAGSIKTSRNKQSKGTCLLALYSIGIFVFFIIFLATTIFFFVGPKNLFGTSCRSGSKTDFVDDVYTMSQVAYASFCVDCGCAVNETSDLYKLMKQKGLNTSGTYVKYTDCPNFTPVTQYSQVLAALQRLLNCGGWCSMDTGFESDPLPVYFYRFSDINDCNMETCYSKLTNCHDTFYDFMVGKGKIAAIGCLIATLVCFVNILAVCCICCHPSKRGKTANFYSRMIEVD